MLVSIFRVLCKGIETKSRSPKFSANSNESQSEFGAVLRINQAELLYKMDTSQ